MRVRMKISYMALLKQMTVKELFLEAILETYNERLQKGQCKKFIGWDDKFFKSILKCRADLRLMSWKNIEIMERRNQVNSTEYK